MTIRPHQRDTSGEGRPPRGRFVVLEGVEGAGKTTQAARLAAWLEGQEISLVSAREPGGTEVGEAIRNVLLHRESLVIPPESELFLMLAARAAFVRGVVLPALEAGRWVVSDRYEFSTFAYQGYGRGLELEEVRRSNRLATGGLQPDLLLLLDVPAETGARRQRARPEGSDRIESEGVAFLERVRQGYRLLAEEEPYAVLIGAGGASDEVQQSIIDAVRARFPETFGHTTG